MKKSGTGLALVVVALLAIAVGYVFGRSGDSEVVAQVSPTGTIDDRDVYYPGTETLAPDECG